VVSFALTASMVCANAGPSAASTLLDTTIATFWNPNRFSGSLSTVYLSPLS
jgi:hypothetical protein